MLKSFDYAGQGIGRGFKDRNMKIHGLAAVVVVVVGIMSKLTTVEWAIILGLIAAVIAAELFNTSIEELANVVKNNNNLDYGETKTTRDLATGAVLVVAAMSMVVGGIIFGSHWWPN